MSDTPHYSAFLHCLYDEPCPRGQIGRGTHYSVLRGATWLDETGGKRSSASIQDLAVIWDEDHDERVIGVIERLYMSGLLFPVLFIGERKGSLTVVLSEIYACTVTPAERQAYEARVKDIAAAVDEDYWPTEFGVFDVRSQPGTTATGGDYQGMLIQGASEKTDIYLRNIYNLWKLGQKPYKA
ncbi:hypothetical protein FHS00_001338 [Limimaricola variabilis]|uniref:Uncharacterized protein n=1 Tax=Limimaricola variabilis TaxID=1492771 RepID=A0ABR6HMH6_9RHOB|nr:hypothetical protein [Limimaricola variabilis]MBB3711767.1 hypothetical protein [Limimaricola variabilis]